ncbi:bifunctional DNA primase/polymerase [Catellatospora coxensis]|uniref:DNA primase n=1 Tax=Catellatospora coxensis TaxID=310354 RepID=A0A8J3L0F2_9ACTN|nr:bifunctional DNA primase/polymerase [Catellatospora coxensis]GIG04440.1 DNA primase [Catellatospora coxensis]
MTTPHLVAVALGLAEQGWHLFPLAPGDKRPAVAQWEQRATTDPDRIRRCWSAGPYGIGIACGPSGLAVLDLDQPKRDQTAPAQWTGHQDGWHVLGTLMRRAHASLPATFTVQTGRGGTHLYFRHPTSGPQLRNTAGKLGWLIDTRAHGGYVVAPGSTVNGRPYRIMCELPAVELPAWLGERLVPEELPPQQPVMVTLSGDQHGRYVVAAISRQLAHLAQAGEGQRNHALYRSAVALGQLAAGGAIGQAEIEGLLTQAAYSAGLRPAETRRTITSGLRAGARRPRSVTA